MALDVGQLIVSGAVGVVDLFVEVKDKDNARTEPMKRWDDYFRVGGLALGLAAQVWMPKYARYGQALALSTMPLVIRSLNDSQQFIKPAASQARNFAPRANPTRVPAGTASRGAYVPPGDMFQMV